MFMPSGIILRTYYKRLVQKEPSNFVSIVRGFFTPGTEAGFGTLKTFDGTPGVLDGDLGVGSGPISFHSRVAAGQEDLS